MRWWNLALGAGVTATALGWVFADESRYSPWVAIVFALVAGAAVWASRDYLLPATGAAQCGLLIAMISGQRTGFLYTALAICLYVVAYRLPRWHVWCVASASAVLTFLAAGVSGLQALYEPSAQLLPVGLALAAVAGRGARNGSERVREAEARARQAEATREAEAQRRVAEERMSIARELHDAVGHHIAVINMQAGLAETVVRSDPAAAEQALQAVRRSASGALGELAAIVHVLRDHTGSKAAPVAGMEQLPALLNTLRAAGMAIEFTTTGEARELPPITDLTAYRIIQEALTNARKYGTGPVTLALDYAHELRIEVVNQIREAPLAPGTAGCGGGNGLRGMAERVAAAGGRFRAGATTPTAFRVLVELPVSDHSGSPDLGGESPRWGRAQKEPADDPPSPVTAPRSPDTGRPYERRPG